MWRCDYWNGLDCTTGCPATKLRPVCLSLSANPDGAGPLATRRQKRLSWDGKPRRYVAWSTPSARSSIRGAIYYRREICCWKTTWADSSGFMIGALPPTNHRSTHDNPKKIRSGVVSTSNEFAHIGCAQYCTVQYSADLLPTATCITACDVHKGTYRREFLKEPVQSGHFCSFRRIFLA
jgi:hypothetical protein